MAYSPKTSLEGKPLRLDELNITGLAKWLNENGIRTSQGKIIQPLHVAHTEIVSDPARYKVVACGRRFGKSLIAALTAMAVLMQMNRRVWIVGPTYNHAEKVFRELYHIMVVQLRLIEPGGKNKGKARNQKGEYFLETPWGSVLEAKSMEKPDSLAGDALDLCIIDEAALQPDLENIWVQMIQPTLMDKEGSALFISTPRGKNSFYKMFLMGQLGIKQRMGLVSIEKDKATNTDNDVRDWSSFQKTSYDNPLVASSPEASKKEIDDAYRRAVLSGKVISFKQEYLADFEAVAETVFPGFIEVPTDEYPYPNIITYNWHPDEGPIFAACDHNYARPASTIFAQINKFGDVVIFDERFTPSTTSYMQAQQILDKEEELNKIAKHIWKNECIARQYWHEIYFEKIVGDISGDQNQLSGRSVWDDFESVLGVRPVGLKQPREVGCNMIRHWLQFPQLDEKGMAKLDEHGNSITMPKLFVTSNCVNVIYAISSAKFKKAKQGFFKEDYEETPEGHEGLLDAIRYLLVYLFHDKKQHMTVLEGL